MQAIILAAGMGKRLGEYTKKLYEMYGTSEWCHTD